MVRDMVVSVGVEFSLDSDCIKHAKISVYIPVELDKQIGAYFIANKYVDDEKYLFGEKLHKAWGNVVGGECRVRVYDITHESWDVLKSEVNDVIGKTNSLFVNIVANNSIPTSYVRELDV
jgi:hypothetical protein